MAEQDGLDTMVFVSYAQNFEDVILWRAFKELDAGFYVDVGAAHADIDSVTRAFYDRGWHGINVEPSNEYYTRLTGSRLRDINLHIALGEYAGSVPFFQVNGTGLSTLEPDMAMKYRADGWEVEERNIEQLTLAEICRRYATANIHFLKIDVEGSERSVLAGADFARFRPWVILVEATRPNSQEQTHTEWEPIVLGASYQFVYFDGLNRFYVAEEHIGRLGPCFGLPPNVFDNFLRAADAEVVRRVGEMRTETMAQVTTARAEAATQVAAARAEAAAQVAAARAEATAQVAAARAEAAEELAALRLQASDAEIRAAEQLAAERLRAIELIAPERLRTQKAETSLAALSVRLTAQQTEHELQLHAFRSEADSLIQRLAAVYASSSWRAMAPLRTLRLLIGRRVGLALMEAGMDLARVERLARVAGTDGPTIKRIGRVGLYLLMRSLRRLSSAPGLATRLDPHTPPPPAGGLRTRDSACLASALTHVERTLAPAFGEPAAAPHGDSTPALLNTLGQPQPTLHPPQPGQVIRTVHQFHSGSAFGDAITNGMFLTQAWLRSMGYRSEIYVEHRDASLADRILLIDDLPTVGDYVLIVRHSMGHNACGRILSLPARKILLYHNITPTKFLSDETWAIPHSKLGRRQLSVMRPHMMAALADSEYNALELRAYGYAFPVACAFLFDVDLLRSRAGGREPRQVGSPFTVLFVGRLVSSKGQADLVDAFAEFRRLLRKPCRLVLVGNPGAPDAPYPAEIRRRIALHGLQDEVTITGSVSDSDLHGWYQAADLYVSLSNHEGFGVPLIEAAAHSVPVIAWPAGAVPYTLGHAAGDEAMLLTDRTPATTAAAMLRIADNEVLAAAVVARQLRVLERFRLERQMPHLIQALIMAGAAPPLDPGVRGPLAANLRIAVSGHTYGSYSLAAVNRTMALALENRTPGSTRIVTTEPMPEGGSPLAHEAWFHDVAVLVSRPPPSTGPEIVISQNYPVLVPEDPGDATVAFVFWEESLLPEATVAVLAERFRGVFAPTSFVAKSLIDSGVPLPVRTIGYVPNLDPFSQLAANRRYSTPAGIFTFLHVSSCFPRKGVDVLLAAYAEAFRRGDPVRLLIKGFPNPHNDALEQIARLRQADPDVAEIVMINEDLDEAGLLNLYRDADAMVLPTRGEGFNMPAAEAMAAGIPLIVTGYGGHLDFCTEREARFLDWSFASSGSHLASGGSVWVEPDRADLVAALREVFTDIIAQGGVYAARAARAREATRLRFDPVVWADHAVASAVDVLVAPKMAPLNVAWVSTWDVACGIAEYSRALLESMSSVPGDQMATPIILCDKRTAASGAADAITVRPAWQVGVPESIIGLARAIANEDPDIVVIQHQPGLITWQALADLLDDRRISSRISVVTLHAAPHLLDISAAERATAVAALTHASRVLVHQVSDLDLLRALGLVNNVALFPQGAPTLAENPSVRPLSPDDLSGDAPPMIGSYGFFLPGKGLPRLIKTVARLRKTWPRVRLRLVNAEYPIPASTQEIADCRALACSLGLDDAIEWLTAFSPNDVSMRQLGGCDLLVLAYDQSKESSSAALRGAMASGVPVAVTPVSVFDDAGDAIHRFAAVDVDLIVEEIDALLHDQRARSQLRDAASRWLAENSWGLLGRRLHGMLLGLRMKQSTDGGIR